MGDPTLKRRSADDFPHWKAILGDSANFVYFIGSPSFSAIKIGVARDPRQRLMDLQIGNPFELHIISILPGGMPMESAFHRRMGDARRRGEWFDGPAVEGLLDYVENLATQMRDHYRDTGEMLKVRYAQIAPVKRIWSRISTEWHDVPLKQIGIRVGLPAANVRREIRAMYLSGLYEVPAHLTAVLEEVPRVRKAA
jgi:hypothetical protein